MPGVCLQRARPGLRFGSMPPRLRALREARLELRLFVLLALALLLLATAS